MRDVLETSGLWIDVAEDSNPLGYNAASSGSVYLTIHGNIPEELNFLVNFCHEKQKHQHNLICHNITH